MHPHPQEDSPSARDMIYKYARTAIPTAPIAAPAMRGLEVGAASADEVPVADSMAAEPDRETELAALEAEFIAPEAVREKDSTAPEAEVIAPL